MEKGLREAEHFMLRRNLGPIQVQLISVGGIVGSSYFLGAGSIIAMSGPVAILAFTLGGIIAWLVAMAVGELCVGMPREGNFVSHSRELLGRPWAAGVGWSYWFNWSAYIPSEMIAGGLILNQFYPKIPVIHWAIVFAVLITFINLLNIKHFGMIESGLSILKLGAIGVFTGVALMIWQGHAGNQEVVKESMQLTQTLGSLNPQHLTSLILVMVLVLVNYQGTEIIALSSAETQNPEKNIPIAARNVAIRTLMIFVLPLIMLLLIFPWNKARVDHSIFVEALSLHRFDSLALIFQAIIITAALSCANSGLYGAVRSLYGLGKEGLAPRWVTHVNSSGVPYKATLMTIAMCWAFLPLYTFFEGSRFYTWLLSLSGFTGALCWISITMCQILFRKKLISQKTPQAQPPYLMPGFPYLSFLALILQVLCLSFLGMHAQFRSSFILGIPAFLLPALFIYLKDQMRKQQTPLKPGETQVPVHP
jgi:amino acid transporter, AAT family